MAEEEKKSEESGSAGKSAIGGLVVKGLLVVLLALIASAGGGVISFLMISRSGLIPAAGTETEVVEGEIDPIRELMDNGAVVALEPFIVNLADIETPRYLRVSISLMVDDKTIVNEVIENPNIVSKTRDVILQTLSRKRSTEIIDEEGKNHLRAEILERLAPIYHEPKVVDVMFTEFVIQL